MIFTLSPSPLDLGSVLMGKSVSGTIVLTNASFFDMTSVGIAVSGAGFSLSPTGTCIGTLGPQQSCNIVVSFTAGTTAGLAKGTVTVRQGGVTKTVAVTATVLSNPEQADAGAPDLVSADVARWTDTLDSDVFFGWDQARIADMGTGWWVNAQKGKFFISTRLRIADAMDGTGRPLAISITEIVTNKSGSTALSLVPLPSELSGKWIYDPEKGETAQGPVVATTFDEASRFFDGGADPFYNSAKGYSAKVSAWANYRETPGDAAYYLDLRIWEMASAADAASLYNDLLQFAYWSPDNVPWKTCQGVAGNPCP
jgi:hypothetical protein